MNALIAEFPSGEGSKISLKIKQKQRQQQEAVRSKPDIMKGVNLVQSDSDRPVFQSLVAGEIQNSGKALWVDSGNNCSTYALRKAGTEDLMRRVEIARCFTPFQHHQMVSELEDFLDSSFELLVVPEISLLYEEGQLNEYEAEELFRETWEKLLEMTEEHDLKLLVSVNGVFSYIVEGEAGNTVKVDETSQGARYRSNRFETLLYRRGNYIQTTVPYWSHRMEVSESGKNERYLQKSS